MLRIIFVTGSLAYGGAERQSIAVMNRLAERGHECHAVYIKEDASQLDRITLAEGGSVHCLAAARFLDRRALRDFAAHLARIQPAAIIAANSYALMYASLAQLLAGSRIPLLTTFHTTRLLGFKEQIKMLLDRPFFWCADRSIFVCEGQKRYWLRRGVCSRHNMVIYNGIDTETFRNQVDSALLRRWRNEYGWLDTDYVIGISAVLRPEKNHVQLVAAVAALHQRGIPARLLIIGDGPMRAAVEARAHELGMADAMRITGFQQDVRPHIAVCDVMVLCSVAVETFSLAALEAMAMGKPVVHAELGGAAEMIIPGDNGFLFPVGDTSALVEHLARLTDRQLALHMGHRARTVVEQRFSETAMVDRYEQTLLSLCEPRPLPPPAMHAVWRAIKIDPQSRSK